MNKRRREIKSEGRICRAFYAEIKSLDFFPECNEGFIGGFSTGE